MSPTAGKVLYALIFVVGVPAALVAWARAAEPLVAVPAIHAKALGVVLASAGIALTLTGMHALIVHGGGLPMNGFPPPRHVIRGPYALLEHPIYVGFCLTVLGASLATGSASGLWLVFPTACLACTALVCGYEGHDLTARFGRKRPTPWLSLAGATDDIPTLGHRLAFLIRVVLPWSAAAVGFSLLGAPIARLPAKHGVAATLASVIPVVLATPWLARTQSVLRRLSVDGLLALGCTLGVCIAVAPGAIPSLYALWAVIVARAFRSRAGWIGCSVVFASCVASGMAGSAALGIAIALAVGHAPWIWDVVRGWTERIANSWKEWHVGPVRIINHGAYAAVGTFVALAIVGELAGVDSYGAILTIWACTLVGAGAWAQWIEAAAGLSRPYGFYGGMLGTIAGCLICGGFGQPVWALLGATCVSGPWVQSIGRLRCLVQGCCHGAPAPDAVGIRYEHERSRVNKVPSLVGVPLHPTPLYSILWNLVVGLVTGRLWFAHPHLHLLCGIYLVLSGVGRFVEESYRGEPQTPVFARLRLYQWVATATVLAGVALMALASSGRAPAPRWALQPLVPALLAGVGNLVALGVDFPRARWRLSRLA